MDSKRTAGLLRFFFILSALAIAASGCWSSNSPSSGTSRPPSQGDESPRVAASGGSAMEPATAAKAGSVVETPPSQARPEEASAARLTPGGYVESAPDSGGNQKAASEEQNLAPGRLPAGEPESPRLGQNPLRNGGNGGSVEPLSTGGTLTSLENVPSGEGKTGEVPLDPIKENGPIFEGWTAPRAVLVITGRQDGYIEPCGCAGLDKMLGGMSRRMSMFDKLRKDWGCPVVGVDAGGLVKGFGPQADMKFQTTVNALEAMGYCAIALGKTDVQSGIGTLISGKTGEESPFVSANVAAIAFDAGLTAQKRVVDVGGIKLGITSILGKTWQQQINNPDIVLADPREKLAEIVPGLRKTCDVMILLAHATEDEARDLAGQFPQFDIVVVADGPSIPPEKPQLLGASKRMLIEVGEKVMYAIVLGFYDDPAHPRYQRVPLDSRFPQSEYMRELMAQYQDGLKAMGLDGLGVTPVPYPGKELMGKFVGSQECKSCHEESYKVWWKSKHAKAWQTLVDLNPPRNFDPECIGCHTVGWSPQNFRPFESGFLSEAKTPQLVNVGCETCHGPGEAHVKAEMGADVALQEKLRPPTVMTLDEAKQPVSNAITDRQHCMNCHDLDNSPEFDFDTDWPKIEHREE
jgi:hypothetical protein